MGFCLCSRYYGHGVGLANAVDALPQHRLGPVVAGDGQLDLADRGARAEAAAGGRNRAAEREGGRWATTVDQVPRFRGNLTS